MKEIKLKTVPSGYINTEEYIMSNSDHEIDEEIAQKIKGKKLTAYYSGWNFHGTVWWENGQWHCEIWQYRSHNATYSAKTLKQLMEDISFDYGWD